MPETLSPARPSRLETGWRLACTIVVILIEQAIACGLAVLPVTLLWMGGADWLPASTLWRAAVVSLLLIPSYVLFALCLMAVSAAIARVAGIRTQANAEMRIAGMSWGLMRWARYMIHIHVVRVFAGTLFRGSPVWTLYLRLNGARIGRRVFVNTLFISDHNLLDIGDDVVIGSEVHISGHTVEAGVVKTAQVRLGDGVTIGVGSVIEIGVEIGAHAQIGALSFVPKHTTWSGGFVYAGIPVRRLEVPSASPPPPS